MLFVSRASRTRPPPPASTYTFAGRSLVLLTVTSREVAFAVIRDVVLRREQVTVASSSRTAIYFARRLSMSIVVANGASRRRLTCRFSVQLEHGRRCGVTSNGDMSRRRDRPGASSRRQRRRTSTSTNTIVVNFLQDFDFILVHVTFVFDVLQVKFDATRQRKFSRCWTGRC
jgi:hypothetical protein